ncbi:hypothetical protein BDN72DRAFT_459748 [Pluteus cervinus]|uniref:Uncharacterized protein n=1 Tax=Pluteus cervinus TaxID=181527 RepID=A0ACD3A6W1_9AGAR|nr:hypothetical protein BDN72DRAFT_459748 [Pluteus cervinus]
MDTVHALPVELWAHILEFIPQEDLKTMRLTHRIFWACATSIVWHRLTLCNPLTEKTEKAKRILENPHLARHVTHLRLHPINWVIADKVEPWANAWLSTAPILSVLNWAHPILSWRYYHQSLESIKVAAEVTPLLIHVREITVIVNLDDMKLDLEALPLEPYRATWAGLRTECLQRLNLKLATVEATQIVSGAIKSASPVVFESLHTLTLDLGVRSRAYPQLQGDLRTILDCGRSSLRTLGFTIGSTATNYFAEVVGAFGVFPNLAQFHFEKSTCQNEAYTRSLKLVLLPFLFKHRSTLKKLHLSLLHFPSTLQTLFEHNEYDDTTLSLEAFTLGYWSWSDKSRMTSFQRFADTLTHLMLIPKFGNHAWVYEDVKMLLDSLRRPVGGIGLKGLSLRVWAISPDLLDLLAGCLTNLERLQLDYGRIAASKDQKNKDDLVLFFRTMGPRSYPLWGLRCLDARPYFVRQDWIPAAFFRRIIPSLEEVGVIDWGDGEVTLGPW